MPKNLRKRRVRDVNRGFSPSPTRPPGVPRISGAQSTPWGYATGTLNEYTTGAWHCGPFNDVKEEPDWNNPDDVACWRHDQDPAYTYTQFTDGDQAFIESDANPLLRSVFVAKRAVAPRRMKRKATTNGRSSKRRKYVKKTNPKRFRKSKSANKRRKKYKRRNKPKSIKKLIRTQVAKMILPPIVQRGETYENYVLPGALDTFLAPKDQENFYSPESHIRYRELAESLAESTTITGVDNEYEFIWSKSTSNIILHNPNNFNLHVEFRLMKRIKEAGTILLNEMNIVLDNTTVQRTVASVASAPTSTYTAGSNTTGCMDRLSVNPILSTSECLGYMKDAKFRQRGKVRRAVLQPGAYVSFKLRRYPGKVKGDKYDSINDRSGVYIPLFRFRAPFMNSSPNDTAANKLAAGTPEFSVTIKCQIRDYAYILPAANRKEYLLNNAVFGCLADPVATNLTVASTVGAANVAADDE